jgi:hypothetical protein
MTKNILNDFPIYCSKAVYHLDERRTCGRVVQNHRRTLSLNEGPLNDDFFEFRGHFLLRDQSGLNFVLPTFQNRGANHDGPR